VLGLSATLFLVGVPFFVSFYHLHRSLLLDELKISASSLGQLVLSSLEADMLAGTPHHLQGAVSRLARDAGVRRIMLLDKRGVVRVSSDTAAIGTQFDRESDPTCQVCHADVDRQGTRIAQTARGDVFRTMKVIANRPACYRCHRPEDRLNGILLMDLSMEQTERQLAVSVRQMSVMAAVMGLVTVIALGQLTRRLVLDRLAGVMHLTSRVRNRQFGTTLPVDSDDEIGDLAESFNLMTTSLHSSLEELEQQQEFLESLLNSLRDEIVVFDRDGRVVATNDAGRERGDVHGGEMFSPLGRQTLRTGQPGVKVEIKRAAEGGERQIELHTYPLCDGAGDVVQVIQVARDITERKYLEAHLMHSERLASLGLLASGISHELNNPLGTISAGIDGLLRQSAGPLSAQTLAEMQEYLTLIRTEVHRAKSITDRLLILSRPSGGPPSLIDVCRAVADTVSLVRYQASRAHIEIRERLDSTVPLIKAHEPSLRQLVLNLLLNAMQAIAGSGTIEAEVRPVENGLEIAIRDDGDGIAPEDLERVFDPFFSRRRDAQGTGLGLFIASSIVDQMGGRIQIESQPGRGTVFRVFIPAA